MYHVYTWHKDRLFYFEPMSIRNFLSFSSILLASVCSALALEAGYYRVNNYATKRYCYVWDNTGKLDWTKTDADMGAIELFKTKDMSDPGAVIYVQPVGDSYDLQAQGSGVYQMIQYYVSLSLRDSNEDYWVYASAQGITKYLCDGATSTRDDRGKMSTATSSTGAAYQLWHATPISAETDEYFGVKPSITVGTRYFQPFYASFPFSFYSEGMKAWYISKVDEKLGVAVISEYTNDVVPAAMPVILEMSTAAATTNRLSLLTGGGSAPADNRLSGCYFSNKYRLTSNNAKTLFNTSTMRVLSVNTEGKLVYTNSTATLNLISNNYYLNANQSYLKVSASAPEELQVMTQEEYEAYRISGVTDITADRKQSKGMIYNLNGQPVRSSEEGTEGLPAGLYLIDGRLINIR